VLRRRRPAPTVRTPKDAGAELTQEAWIATVRKRRKAAVANHFTGDTLLHLLHAVFQHLQIGEAVEIDKGRRNRQPGTVDHGTVGRREYCAGLSDPIPVNQHGPRDRRLAGTGKEKTIR